MDKDLKKIAIQLFILTILLTIAGFLVMKYILPEHYFTGYLFMPLLLFVITFSVHRYLVIASREDSKKFTYKFMGATGLKMFIYLVMMVIYLLLDKNHAVPFLVSFLILYVLYSLFEVLAVLKYLKNNR